MSTPTDQTQALADFLARHVRPYDPVTDDYERPPFAADIKEGKNDPIYNAHSYHTKVPPRSIIPYILHYTQPGDLVLDVFCGSGMTGVAAQMCANPPADILDSFPELKDRVGPRACILNDLSPAACHIAYNYNTPVDVEALKREFDRIKAAVKDEFDWLYGTEHYEPAVGLYDPANYEVARRLKTCGTGVPPVSPRDAQATFTTYNPHVPVERRQGAYLPHWTQTDATYAVGFRLGDSLPQPVWESFLKERNDIIKRACQQGRELSDAERERLDELYSDRIEAYLDAGHGACWLRQEPVAQLMQNALRHFDGQRYRLAAWCVMPNHVHVIVQPLADHTLPDILHSWKSYTSKEALKILGRDAQATACDTAARGTGVPPVSSPNKFWQAEYYDHLVRNQSDFERQVRYALDNPAKAGLKDWKWLGRTVGLLPRLYPPGAAPDKMLGQDGQATCDTGVPPVSPNPSAPPVTQAQTAPARAPGELFPEELGQDAQATRTWELLAKAQVEARLGYPVTELPRDDKWGDLDVATVKQWVCIPATIQYTIWSDVYHCEGFVTIEEPTGKISTRGKNADKPILSKKRVARGCGKAIVLWEAAVNQKTREVSETFACPHCGLNWKKIQIRREPAIAVKSNVEYIGFQSRNGATRATTKTVMRPVTKRECGLVAEINETTVEAWLPTVRFDKNGPQYRRNALSARKIDFITDLFTRRNLHALAQLWAAISATQDARHRCACAFAFTAIVTRSSWLNRLRPSGAGDPQTGTIYISSLTREENVLRLFEGRFTSQFQLFAFVRSSQCCVINGSACSLPRIPDGSVDYVFTDPPFGSNIYYSEPNLIWEAWLGKVTDATDEAVVHRKNDGGTKRLPDYARLMQAAFAEIFRVLKPGRWATVEFNNSDGAVFEAVKQAIRQVGFEIVNMLLLDKEQKTFKQVKGAEGVEDVVDKDVLFNLYKPAVARAEISPADHDLEHQVADAVRQHLQTLPERIKADPTKYNDEHRTTATINSMLMNALIPRGVSVERLNLPFIERVCTRFFRKIGQHWYLRGEAVGGNGGNGFIAEEVTIKDEVSAIDWLRQKLRGTGVPPVAPIPSVPPVKQGQDAPATPHGMLVGELKPYWQKATGLLPADVSQSLLLDHLLTENFWRDLDTNRWREPTAEERERMNDDRSLRVLHDAERFVAGTLNRPSTDDERCGWIEVLFQACRAVEDNEMDALPALRDFDKAEAYSLITRLFQSVLKDHVTADVFRRVEKQYRAASNKIASQVEKEAERKQKNQQEKGGQGVLNLE